MRWDNLTTEAIEHSQLPGYREPAVVRTFDAPEAMGIRFHEVRAKSVLNKVPEASRMPFRWTVNPYRGCTHACTYCLDGSTLVLMADGSTRHLRSLRVGDRIIGTQSDGAYRRYTETSVEDVWSSVKPAYRVVLADGTELIASGDHRFLSRRGWKHVTGTEQGRRRRPHLTLGTELIGPGRLLIDGAAIKSDADLRVVSVEPLGMVQRLYDITTGTGDFIANGVVSHNCFARPTHEFLGWNAGEDFEREIVVKVNTPEVLRAELARPSWRGEHVALGTNTDPYQWVEGRYGLTRGVWEALLEARNPCSVLTKSPLLVRDLDLMVALDEVTDFSASLSIPTLDPVPWRLTEPHTPSPRARIEAVRTLAAAGLHVGVFVAPLMPGINDSPEQVEEIVSEIRDAGAATVGGIALHVRGSVRAVFFSWLRENRPDLVPRYEQLYARGAYVPAAERRRIEELLRTARRRVGFRFAHEFDRWRDRELKRRAMQDPAPRQPSEPQASLF